MSLEGQNLTALENKEDKQRFVLGTKEGLSTFYDFLVSEEGQIDALDPHLAIEDLALPENVVADLKQLRLAYGELVALTKEGLQLAEDDLPEKNVVKIADQYGKYIGADEKFSRAYVAYEASLENTEQSSDTAPEPNESEDAQSIIQTPEESTLKQQSVSLMENLEMQVEVIESAEKEIDEQYHSIQKTYDAFCQRFPEEKRTPEITHLVGILQDLHSRASLVHQKAKKKSELNLESTAENLQNYKRSIQRIRKDIDSSVSDVSDAQIDNLDFDSKESVVPVAEKQEENNDMHPKVFGMDLPEAGEEGTLVARNFRDGLEMVKRNHPEIKRNREKLAIVEALIRVLFVVPAGGLTEVQTREVARLAKELSVLEKKDETSKNIIKEETSETLPSPEVESDREESPEEIAETRLAGATSWTTEEETKKKGVMKIEADSQPDGDIKITYAGIADQVERNTVLLDDSVPSAINQLTENVGGKGVVAHMEKKDTINNSIPVEVARNAAKREMADEHSLVGIYLADNPKYQVFFKENDVSSAALEKELQKVIKSVDASAIDFWESKFDDPYESAFSFLQEMTLQEVQELNELPLDERKRLLREENVKYEAYLAWMDTYDFIAQIVELQPNMKFFAMIVKWMIETEMTEHQSEPLVA